MSSPYTVHPMEAVFRAGEIERAAHDRKIAELWKAVQGEQHDDALDYFRRGFFLGSNYQKDQLASEASPLGHAAKEAECVAKCLDDAGTPKTDGGKELSLWGRVVRYAAPVPAGVQGDAARLDFLDAMPGYKWMARQSTTGRGFRVHQCPDGLHKTARDAIDAAIAQSTKGA
jgi:hypothetical protein